MKKGKILVVLAEMFLIASFSITLSYFLNVSFGSDVGVASAQSSGASSGGSDAGQSEQITPEIQEIIEGILRGEGFDFTELQVAFSRDIVGIGGLPQGSVGSLSGSVSICPLTNDNKVCQIYSRNNCESICQESCTSITSFRDDAIPIECKIGYCIDTDFGTCQPNSPQERCEASGADWITAEEYNERAECRAGCCIIGEEVVFETQMQCLNRIESFGLEISEGTAWFDGSITTEIGCLEQGRLLSESLGACVFESASSHNDCTFTTEGNCVSLGGDFRAGYCSDYPDTNCEAEARTGCVDGRDEVFWFDSCGNREAIEDECGIEKSTTCSPLDENGEANCKDLSCEASELTRNKKRENGESWCFYQGAVGTAECGIFGTAECENLPQVMNNIGLALSDLPFSTPERAVDTPGSRHFRVSCENGEVKPVSCGDYRNKICVEGQSEEQSEEQSEGTFSQAFCRPNRWKECINYNPTYGKGITKEKVVEAMVSCNKDPDCYINFVNVDKDFQFPFCAPKYPPGLDEKNDRDGANALCGMASQTCTRIEVKQLSGNWECVANCNCDKPKFFEQMNDLCMSLGDCGLSFNYEGDRGGGGTQVTTGKETKTPLFGIGIREFAYAAGLQKYAEPKEGYSIPIGNIEEFLESIGASSGGDLEEYVGGPRVRAPRVEGSLATELSVKAGATAGVLGTGILAVTGTGMETAAIGETGLAISVLPPPIVGFAGALAGAGIGVAAVGLLLKYSGVGAGLPDAVSYALIGAGAFSGATIGLNLAQGLGACATGPGCIVAIVVLVIIAVLKLLGVGEIKKEYYNFECRPWEPPSGGAKCEVCNEGELPCSLYACEALGGTCEFIGEEPNGICVSVAHDDTTSPTITPSVSALGEGIEYQDITERGFKVRKTSGDGCLTQFERAQFGIELDERARCKIGAVDRRIFDDMSNEFGNGGSVTEHVHAVSYGDLRSLLPELSDREEVNVKIICKDAADNEGEAVVSLCINPVDLKPPRISSGVVSEYLPFGIQETEVVVFVEEPSEVRWSLSDRDFEQMEGTFECTGLRCTARVPVSSEETRICVKGRDLQGNPNAQCTWITLRRSASALISEFRKPRAEERIITGLTIAQIETEIETSGGADGRASCYYSIDGEQFILFGSSGERTHRATIQRAIEGEHIINARCEDIAGNSATASLRFFLEKDLAPPNAVRVYIEGGTLVLLTDEKAQCSFVNAPIQSRTNACNFNVAEGTSIFGELPARIKHSFGIDRKKTYYIKCKDDFGNERGGECSSIVRRGEI